MDNGLRVAKNTFGEGVIMDFSPDNTQATVLSNALNATLLTYNGNEMNLQNDMGNGRVETAYLPEGYIPMGTCEFGGIIYIVSYNPQDDLCQIGCFPSPEKNITQDELADNLNSATLTSDYFQDTETGKLNSLVAKVLIRESSLNPGDKYIIETNRTNYTTSDGECISDLIEEGAKKLKLSVVSIEDSGKITKLDTQNYSVTVGDNKHNYILPCSGLVDNTSSETDIDSYRKQVTQNYNVFSSKFPGKLAILAELETVSTFSCTHRIVTTEIKNDIRYDIFMDYTWESDDSNIYPKYITVTDWEWTNLLNSEYYTTDSEGNTYSIKFLDDNSLDTSFSVEDRVLTIDRPCIVSDNKSIFYHTLNSINPNLANYTYQTSTYTDGIKTLYFNNNTNDSTISYKLGETIGEKEVVQNLGLSATTKICSITVPKEFGNYLFKLPLQLKYTITPAMDFGLLDHLSCTGLVDFSLIGTKVIEPSGIKYLVSEDILTLNINSEIYEEENHKVTALGLDFYDLNGFCGNLTINNRESYAGNIPLSIPLNSVSLNKYKFGETDEYYHNIQISDPDCKLSGIITTEEKSDNDAGILYFGLLYRVKLTYTYSTLDPISQKVSSSESITKWFWVYNNGQFNDYYYTQDDFRTLSPTVPLIYSYEMQDKTTKSSPKLDSETKTTLDKLINDSENADSYTSSLTSLTSYSGKIQLKVKVGIADGSSYQLIANNNITKPSISLSLINPYDSTEKTNFCIIEEQEENSEEDITTYTKYDTSTSIKFESPNTTLNLDTYSTETLDIDLNISNLQTVVTPTKYKSATIQAQVLTPILYKTDEESSFNYEEVGGETMFQTAISFNGGDDSSDDSAWYETLIQEGSTQDSLIKMYSSPQYNLHEGDSTLSSYYASLGSRQPFTLFGIQIPEPSSDDSGYKPTYVSNVYANGQVSSDYTNPVSTDYGVICEQNGKLASLWAPNYTDRAFIPALVTTEIANDGYSVCMSSSGGSIRDVTLISALSAGRECIPYTSHTYSELKTSFYQAYLSTLKQILTVNPDCSAQEIGTFEYNEEACKSLQLISVVAAQITGYEKLIENASDVLALYGVKFSDYISQTIKRTGETYEKEDNTNISLDLSELGQDSKTILTFINYSMSPDLTEINKYLETSNQVYVKYRNGYMKMNGTNNSSYVDEWSNKLIKFDIDLDNTKFYLLQMKSDEMKLQQYTNQYYTVEKSTGNIIKRSNQNMSLKASDIFYSNYRGRMFYGTTMSIDDFIWDVSNNKHHFYYTKANTLQLVRGKYSYALDNDTKKGTNEHIRRYYIGPSFESTFK